MKTVECNAAIVYPVKCTVRRSREPKTFYVRDQVPISIPVIGVSDVCQAVRIEQRRDEGSITFVNRVFFDGKLFDLHRIWAGAPKEGSLGDKMRNRVAEVKKTTDFLCQQSEINAAPWGRQNEDRFIDALPASVDTIIENGRDFIRDETARIAGSMVFVGDKLYQPMPCPFIQVDHNFKASVNPSSIELVRNALPKSGIVFSPLRSNEAIRFQDEFKSCKHVLSLGQIHIHHFDEALVGPLYERERNAEAAVHILLRRLRDNLPDLSPNGLAALSLLAKLRDAAKSRDPTAPDAILRELSVFERAGFHFKANEDTASLLKRAVLIGREGIQRSPVSLAVAKQVEPGDDLDDLSCLRI